MYSTGFSAVKPQKSVNSGSSAGGKVSVNDSWTGSQTEVGGAACAGEVIRTSDAAAPRVERSAVLRMRLPA